MNTDSRHASLYVVPDKFIKFVDPDTNVETTIERTILVTNKECNAEFGDVRWKETAAGKRYLDYMDLVDLTGKAVFDYPAGMEVIVLACDMTAPKIPVMFNHPAITANPEYGYGTVRKTWFNRDDLDFVSGNKTVI